IAARQRRDDLLSNWSERNNTGVDDIAARFLVFRNHVLECGVLLGDKTLGPPHARGPGGRVRDEGTGEGSGRCETNGPTETRTPADPAHALPPLSPLVLRKASRPLGRLKG